MSDWQARRVRREGERMAQGIYAAPGADAKSLASRALAALAAAPKGSMVTGVTAYALTGLPLPAEQERQARGSVHLAVPKTGGQRPRRPGVIVHLFSAELATHQLGSSGILVTDPRQWWVDAARHLAREAPWEADAALPPTQRGRFNTPERRAWLHTVQMGDVLVRRQQPFANLAAFGEHVGGLARSPGIRLVRQAFGAVRAGTDSLPETQVRLALVEAGFPEPAVNHPVVVGHRRRYLDICWPEQWIDLEYQGAGHFDNPGQAKQDMIRRGELQREGWTVIEASARDLDDPGKLFARLAAAFSW
jgi:hypothetical protein